VHFYEVGGLLVRRWVPAQRRKAMEVWSGDGWAPYLDVDRLLRHGQRLTEEQALALLHATRDRFETWARLDDDEARAALHARLRRSGI
jgi:hypothetical protein